MSFLFGLIFGIGLGGWLGWEASKKASTYVVKNVTVNLNAYDLIDIIDSEDAVELLKKETDL